MTITYEYEGSLYINMTNRCSNACDFCIRTQADGFYADSLWLEREPTVEEIIADIDRRHPERYESVVFCGYGEPTERLDELLLVCDHLRQTYKGKIRLNTNGHASLIHGRDTTPQFAGRLDVISISLNAADAEAYDSVCHSEFGLAAYEGMLRFAEDVKRYVPEVVLSVVKDTIPDGDIEKCRAIAEKIGVRLRVREYIQTK